MSDDLIKALQKEACEDAEIITRLRAENKRLREALKPFRWPASAMYEAIHGGEPSNKIISVLLEIGDMRRARAALEGSPK